MCDVGGGTGFCTLGVVETVKPENVTLVDQSPHQLAKAKAKPALQSVTIKEVSTPVAGTTRGQCHVMRLHLLLKSACTVELSSLLYLESASLEVSRSQQLLTDLHGGT